MNGLGPSFRRTARVLVATAAGLALLGGAACDAGKPKPPVRPPLPESAPRVVPAPLPPVPTNAPPAPPPVARTPTELFQAGLKLLNGKGAARDPAEAVKLFLAAAERGIKEKGGFYPYLLILQIS